MPDNIQADWQNETILATLEASIAVYGDNAAIIDHLEKAGWIRVDAQGSTNDAHSYHGIAFCKTFADGHTAVIIANRGSQSLYDFIVSDAQLAFNVVPESDIDALNYYDKVVDWVRGKNFSGPVEVIETGHSLGGHEADFVEVSLPPTGLPTIAVTFDAPGQSTTTAASAGVVNALNISLRNELVHSGGAILNAGYLGSSITIGRGINPAVAALTISSVLPGGLGLLAGFVAGFVYNHGTGRLTNYFAQSPALGGVNLKVYAPTQVSQPAADALGDVLANIYNHMSASDLARLYSSLLGGAVPSAPTTTPTLKETFTVQSTDNGFVLNGSMGDTITATIAGNQETLQDSDGNQIVLSFNSAGTELVNATYTIGDPITGSIDFSSDGSARETLTYDSGAYATVIDDGWGNVTTDYFTKSGVHYASDWIHSDGTSGTSEVFANGLVGGGGIANDAPSDGQIVNPDGSYIDVERDELDKTTTTKYNADGSYASQTTSQGSQSDFDQSAVARTVTSGPLTYYYDAQGNLLRDSWTGGDGSSGSDTYHASHAITGTTHNADGSKDTYTLYAARDGGIHTFVASPFVSHTLFGAYDATRTHFNPDGTIAADTWQLTDGASGKDSFSGNGAGTGTITHADGSTSTMIINATGGIVIDNFDRQGDKASEDWWNADGTHGVTLFDMAGNVAEKFSYRANGEVDAGVYAQDGSVVDETTLRAGELLSPDGSRFSKTDDANGGYDIDYWDSNGDVTMFRYSAGVLQNIDHASPAGKSLQTAPHNAYTPQYTQPDGTAVTAYLDGSGNVTGSDWTRPDGSHGVDIVDPDGSSYGVQTRADGASTTYEQDAQGNLVNEAFDANGMQTSDLWKNADGSHGFDNYNADGSCDGASYTADGSYSAYTDDGQGGTVWSDYSAGGALIDDTWQQADGSSGWDVFNADGSSAGTNFSADGTSTRYTNDGHGDTRQTFFDAQDEKISDAWAKADGSHGYDSFWGNGASSGTIVNADGSYSTYSNDGRGHIVTYDYDPQGHAISIPGTGETSATTTLPDGSQQTTSTDRTGTTTTVTTDPSGTPISSVWTRADGSLGRESLNADGTTTNEAHRADGSYSVTTTSPALGETLVRSYDWQGGFTGSVITQVNGAGNTITSWRDASGVKIAERFTHADGTTGADRTSAYDFVGEQNLAPGLPPGGSYYADWYLPSRTSAYADRWVQARTSEYDPSSESIDAQLDVLPGFDPAIPSSDSRYLYISAQRSYQPSGPYAAGYGLIDPQLGWLSNGRAYVDLWDGTTGVEINEIQLADGSRDLIGSALLRRWTTYHLGFAADASTPLQGTVAGRNGTTSTFYDDGQGNGELIGYDAMGRKIDDLWWHNDGSMGADRFLPDGTATGLSGGPDGRVTTYTADAKGHITSSHTANGNVTVQLTPPTPPIVHISLPGVSGRLPPGGGVQWTVIPNRSQPDGHGGQYAYFDAPDGSVTTLHLDAAGKPLNLFGIRTDPGYFATATVDGTAHTWNYDADGRPTSRSTDDGFGTVVTHQLDAAGGVATRTVAVTDGQGTVFTRNEDGAGQLTGTSTTTTSVADGITTRTTTLLDAAGHGAGSTVGVSDGQGNSVTTRYDASGAVQSSSAMTVTASNSVISTDYDAAGNPTFAFTSSVDANGVIQTSTYDGNGDLTGTVVATPDGPGKITTTHYGASGELTRYVISSTDAQDNSVFEIYDAAGRHLRENIIAANGVQTNTVFNADGTSQSRQVSTDGSFSVTSLDAQGSSVTTHFSAQGVKLSDTWSRGDGSQGGDTFNADGSVNGTAIYADGTHASSVTAASGDVSTTHYAADGTTLAGTTFSHRDATTTFVTSFDASGAKLSGHWASDDGSTGDEIHSADGSGTGSERHADGTSKAITYNADGSYSWVQHDAQGRWIADYTFHADGSWFQDDSYTYADDGFVLGDTWKASDGSYGWDTYDRDGHSTGTSYQADGSHETATYAPAGNSWSYVVTQYDANGVKTGDWWRNQDGSGEDTFNPDGSSTGTWHSVAGPDWSSYIDDGLGDVTTTYFDASAAIGDAWTRADGSHGTTTFNADGTISGTRVSADGTSVAFTDAPRDVSLVQPIADSSVREGGEWTYTVPADAFFETDRGDMLAWSATLSDGGPLPAWLTFDARTRTFAGTPAAGSVGDVSVRVMAANGSGASAADVFTLSVVAANSAPFVAQALSDQNASEDVAWSCVVPATAFADADANDSLTYSASLANGAALPSWITFDRTTRTFSGTPGPGDVGDLSLKVIATDTGGLSASQAFSLHVHVSLDPNPNANPNLYLVGTIGKDSLVAGAGNDTLDGGGGQDRLMGGAGDDTYISADGRGITERAGEGIDTLMAYGRRVRLGANVENLTLTGTANSAGMGNGLDNVLAGNSGNNRLTGGAGCDTLSGGGGKDTLAGGAGNDTYSWTRSANEQGVIQQRGSAASDIDTVAFASDIAFDQLWFQQSAWDLKVTVIGTGTQLTIRNWYSDDAFHVERFKSGDGRTLLESQIQNLVDAMAGFSVPATTTLAPNYQSALAPTLAANWQ